MADLAQGMKRSILPYDKACKSNKVIIHYISNINEIIIIINNNNNSNNDNKKAIATSRIWISRNTYLFTGKDFLFSDPLSNHVGLDNRCVIKEGDNTFHRQCS